MKRGARPGPALAQGRGGGGTESLGIRPGAEQEIEGTGVRAERIESALTAQALLQSADLTGDVSKWGQRHGACVHPGGLLGTALPPTAYRAPIGAASGRSWRCPPGTRGRFNAR